MGQLTTSRLSAFREVAAEWDHELNGILTPDDVTSGSNKKVYWICQQHGHSWLASIAGRTRDKTGCPVCANRQLLSGFNDLKTKFPDVAAEWDHEENHPLTPENVLFGSPAKAHWRCRKHGHQWVTKINLRTRNNRGCPICANQQVLAGFNDLKSQCPSVAREWDYEENGQLSPDEVTSGSKKEVHWVCSTHGHKWPATIKSRARDGNGCPYCSGQRVLTGFNDLKSQESAIAEEWDYDENSPLDPSEVGSGSPKNVQWKCKAHGHTWKTTIAARTRKRRGCPYCANQQVLAGFNDLKSQFPAVAKEWDYAKNAPLKPEEVIARSKLTRHWVCPKGHKYRMQVDLRTRALRPQGCHCQARTWNIRKLEGFIADLAEHTDSMTPAMRYAVCQQAGVLTSSKSDVIGEMLADPARLTALLDNAGDEPGGEGTDLSGLNSAEGDLETVTLADRLPAATDISSAVSDTGVRAGHEPGHDPLSAPKLPSLDVNDVFGMGEQFFASVDEDTAEFLTVAAAAQIWKVAYQLHSESSSELERARLQAELDKTREPHPNQYAERIRRRFRSEYEQALAITPPANWSFRPGNAVTVTAPNLMQKHVAAQVVRRRRVGNWSGTGAGKTVSAILAAGLLDAGQDTGIVLVVCPNNVVAGWVGSIHNCYPDARVESRTLTPTWARGSGARWLVVNYDRLPGNEGTLQNLISGNRIDMLIIDEVHYVKERENVAPSQRRKVLAGIAVQAAESNPNLAVLGMSATPVVNDLHEARSLLELVEGVQLDDVNVARTLPNAMLLHQHLTRVGSRWMPDYSADLDPVTLRLNVSHRLNDVLALGKNPSPAALDQTLLLDKLDTIVEHCRSAGNTLIYTQFVTGIVEPLTRALTSAGLRVGLFTGDDKDGYARFVGTWPNGDLVSDEDRVDVLIGSEAISTGVDGLQHVCDTLIFATLPWTHANYQQIIGRIHRQGQASQTIKVVIPSTFADITTSAGEEHQWSWCGQRWARVEMKESLSDCAVDGVVPKGVLISPSEAARASIEWLRRLTEAESHPTTRKPLDQRLGEDVERLSPADRVSRYTELSRMNGAWSAATSAVTHSRLTEDPTEWRRYHELYTQARRDWTVVPAYQFAAWLNDRTRPSVVADLGCGELLLEDKVSGPHTMLPFDHVAADDRVTVCDIAAVPLDDASVDIAVLSLALMGKNHTDYIREAHRILPIDGHLWLCEPTSSIGSDETRLREVLAAYGFDLYRVQTAGQFTFLRAIKSDMPALDTAPPIKLSQKS